jgi:outer membrane protein insertion porin family
MVLQVEERVLGMVAAFLKSYRSSINFLRASKPFAARREVILVVMFCLSPLASANAQLGDFLGRRVTSVDVVIEGVPGSSVAEMRTLLDVAPGQDFSPVRVHDSLARLYRSGLISGAGVEATPVGADGVALRFVVRPQARIDNVIFQGTPGFPVGELKARLNELDTGQRLSAGAVDRGKAELLAFYSSRGYYKATVTPEVRLDPTGTRAVVVYTVEPGAQARVSTFNINVRGAEIDLSKVPHPIAEGQPFTQAAVQDMMDHVRDAYIKQDYLAVRVRQNISPDVNNNTVAVAINVTTGPKVTVEVQGLQINEKDKRSTLPFYRQGGIDEFSLEEGRRRLQDYAQRKGYFFAQVIRPDPPAPAAPAAQLVYRVEPGRRYRLSNIEIEGLDAIPHQTLESEMKTKEASPIPIPLVGNSRGITSDDFLRQDANLILKRLREIGYRRAQVDVRRGVSLTGESLIVTFDVQQGPRSYVEEVGVRGNNVLTTEELRQELTIKPTDALLASALSRNTDQLLTAYNNRGYASTEVTTQLVELGSFDGQDRVRLLFDIRENNRVRIRNVSTRGTAHTDPGRLERDFYLFKEGEWLRTDRIQETERQLYDTNAFTSVNITSEPVGQTANGIEEREVTVNLLEAKRRDLIFGFGFQTNNSSRSVPGLSFLNGVRGLVQLTDTNMFGKLYTGSTQLRVARTELFGQVSFQNPHPFGTDFPTLISLFARRLAEKSFRTDRYTAVIQSERRLSEQFIVYASYNFEVIKNDLPPDFPEEELQRNARSVRLGRIGPSFLRDTRDNKFDPTTGTQTLGSFYFASSFLGGNESFVKLLLEHNRYYPLRKFRDTVYTVSGRLGLGTPFGGRNSLPISERFFAGGARDLRGFGFEEAGPHIFVRDRDAQGNVKLDKNGNEIFILSPQGGNAVLVINNELRFPIWRSLGGQVFSDTGNVFRRVRDIKPGDLTQTLGFGLRIKTPIGPVRFDLGWLIFNKPADVSGFHRHFTIGQTF